MNNKKDNVNQEETISLREIIMLFRDYLNEIFSKWWIIFILCLFTCGYMGYKAVKSQWKYSANVKFMIEGSGNGNIGGLGGLLGNIGLGSQKGRLSPFKILEVAKSNVIIKDILLDSSNYNSEIIANSIIDIYDLDKKWGQSAEKLENFKFNNADFENFSNDEKKSYRKLVRILIGSQASNEGALLKISLNDETGVMSIESTTINEELSLELSLKMYDLLKGFFEEKAIKNLEKDRSLLKLKKDSIKSVLESNIIRLANIQDSNRGLVTEKAKVKQRLLSNEISGISLALHEISKNFEIADFNYKNYKSKFLLIDKPYMPIFGTKPTLMINLIIGVILGCFLGVLFIVIRKIYKTALVE